MLLNIKIRESPSPLLDYRAVIMLRFLQMCIHQDTDDITLEMPGTGTWMEFMEFMHLFEEIPDILPLTEAPVVQPALDFINPGNAWISSCKKHRHRRNVTSHHSSSVI